MGDEPHMIPVSYKWAEKENKVGECYELWIKMVPHLDPMTRGQISREWNKDSVRLMVPEEEWEKLINPK